MNKIAGLLGSLLGLLSVQAIADEGIVKIDQAAVKAAGGFPYTISKPGSYRLTGNLTVPAAKNGINVDTSNVLIDLAGFTITCLGGPNTSGISSDGGTVYYSNVKIHQGTITGCNNAVNFYTLAQDVEVQELTASNYGSYGVIIDSGAVRRSVLTGALVPANNTVSIGLASYGVIEANTLSGDAYGIAAAGVQRLIVSGNLIAPSIGAFILETTYGQITFPCYAGTAEFSVIERTSRMDGEGARPSP